VDAHVILLRNHTKGWHDEVCTVMRRRKVLESGGEVTCLRQNRAEMTEVVADSGNKTCWPGGEFVGGRRGESEREAWGSYRRGKASY
jgi:hypothetical protein